jgi:TetR/AcrR family transcriptional regulator, lmrAB and yxaGH operons repressor
MTVVIELLYPDGMAANKNQTKHLATDRRRSPARARMVQSAATLIRERGIHGTGLREVVAHSGGPRGSLGRFFPGGKTQLVTEAIDVALVDLFGDLERRLGDAETFPEAINVIVTPWRRLLVDHDFALGCPLAATICDVADNDSLRTHVSESFAWWRGPVGDAYVRFGAPPAEAEAHATVLVAALEGALILARAQRSIEPLDTVERFFASRAPDPRRT